MLSASVLLPVALRLSSACSVPCLLRLDAAGTVTHVSENSTRFVGISPEVILRSGIPLIGLSELLSSLTGETGAYRIGRLFVGKSELEARVVRDVDGETLVELCPIFEEKLPDLQGLRRPLLYGPQGSKDIRHYRAALLEGMSAVTGFDRIMIYRFHEDWSGEVIAEHLSATLGSYLGLRFPASDIPAIARRLYLLNPCRHIPDISAPAVPIRSVTGTPNDLTHTDLRSVSPIHLVYLANMGVGASFSIPLRIAGNLWGLVACHHGTARYLSQSTRDAAVSLARTFCISTSSILTEERMKMIDSTESKARELVQSLWKTDDVLVSLERIIDQLRNALNASGMVVADNEVICSRGVVPAADDLSRIDHWFREKNTGLFMTDHLSGVVDDCPSANTIASGLLAMTIKLTDSRILRLYWFRREEAQEVSWAGNPHKQGSGSSKEGTLSPRHSFDKWVEVRAGYCLPWSDAHRVMAFSLRTALLNTCRR